MAPTNAIINGQLTFIGATAGQVSLQAQTIGQSYIANLPNTIPNANQLLSVLSVNGNVVTLGWAAAQSSTVQLSQLSTAGATSGDVIQYNGTSWAVSASVPGSGTVTSVALTAPAEFTVGGSPITGAGTLAITKATQAANTVWAGPASAGPTAPTFRALVVADIPSLASLYDALGAAAAAQSAAETFATAADVTVLSSAETFATSAISTALASGTYGISITGNAATATTAATATNATQLGGIAAASYPTFGGSGTFTGNPVFSGNVTFSSIETPSAMQLSITSIGSGQIALNGAASSQVLLNASGAISLTTAAAEAITLTTASGVFTFSGTGGGMSFASQNALVAIDASGDVSIASATAGGTATTTIQGALGGVEFNASGKGEAQMLGPIALNAYIVANLPVGAETFVLYAVDGRKVGEGVGAGTGVPVYFSNGQWRVFSTDQQVQA